jgi:hypothetical protein
MHGLALLSKKVLKPATVQPLNSTMFLLINLKLTLHVSTLKGSSSGVR